MNQSRVQRNQWKEEPDALVKDAGIDILTYHMLEMTWQLDNSTLKEQQKTIFHLILTEIYCFQ